MLTLSGYYAKIFQKFYIMFTRFPPAKIRDGADFYHKNLVGKYENFEKFQNLIFRKISLLRTSATHNKSILSEGEKFIFFTQN